jgi:hypothetical protein
MICGGTSDVQDLKVAAGLLGDAGEHVAEVLARNGAGATARDEDSSWRQQGDSGAIEPVVGH